MLSLSRFASILSIRFVSGCSVVQTGIINNRLFVNNTLSVQTHNICNIYLTAGKNKTADCFNNIVFILVAKISSKKVCEKMVMLLVCNRNAELLQLVGATFDSKVALLRKMRKKNFIIMKSLQKIIFCFICLSFVEIWVVKHQLKMFGKL